MKIAPEEFIRAWQLSDSVAEVMAKTNLTWRTATKKASDYRKRGIPLKRHRRGARPLDVVRLAAVAKACEKLL